MESIADRSLAQGVALCALLPQVFAGLTLSAAGKAERSTSGQLRCHMQALPGPKSCNMVLGLPVGMHRRLCCTVFEGILWAHRQRGSGSRMGGNASGHRNCWSRRG